MASHCQRADGADQEMLEATFGLLGASRGDLRGGRERDEGGGDQEGDAQIGGRSPS